MARSAKRRRFSKNLLCFFSIGRLLLKAVSKQQPAFSSQRSAVSYRQRRSRLG